MPSLYLRRSAATKNIKIYKRLARTQIAPETPDNERYKNRRLLALYFDMSAMRPADQLRALARGRAVHPHADDHRRSGLDHALQQAGSVDILQDFTRTATAC